MKAMANWAINITQIQSQWSREFSQDTSNKVKQFL